MNISSRFLFPIFGLFAVLCILILLFSGFLNKYSIDSNVLLVANVLFLILHVTVFLFQKKVLP